MACGLEQKILAHRRLLEDVNVKVEASLNQHSETNSKLEGQAASLDTLVSQVEAMKVHSYDQSTSVQAMQSTVENTREQTTSILASVMEVLSLVTSGLITLRSISEQMYNMLNLCAKFTTEMRLQMGKLLQLFSLVQASLH
jgi:methyl-accepting chemotaxis protein